MSTDHVARLLDQLLSPEAHLPEPVREHRFHPVRKWRFDLAWPEQLVAVEVDGGVYVQGRHTRGAAFEGDCEKINEAAILGWRVLRVTPNQIRQGKALVWIMAAVAPGERRQESLKWT